MSTIEIELTQGQVTLIDSQYQYIIQKHKWYAGYDPKIDGYYAQTNIKVNGKYTMVQMHRFLWKQINGSIPKSMMIDHINGNSLDNRIENLRLVTNRVNQHNGKNRRNGKCSSKYIGVCWNKIARKWQSQIMVNGKKYGLGYFDSEEESSACYRFVLWYVEQGLIV